MYIAHHLLTLGHQFRGRLNNGTVTFVDLVPGFRRLGESAASSVNVLQAMPRKGASGAGQDLCGSRWTLGQPRWCVCSSGTECFLAQMQVQKGELLERLSSARNFSSVDDEDNYSAANRAVRQVSEAEPAPAPFDGPLVACLPACLVPSRGAAVHMQQSVGASAAVAGARGAGVGVPLARRPSPGNRRLPAVPPSALGILQFKVGLRQAASVPFQVLHQLKRLGVVWQDVLPVNVYCRAMGTLLNTALGEMVARITALEVRTEPSAGGPEHGWVASSAVLVEEALAGARGGGASFQPL